MRLIQPILTDGNLVTNNKKFIGVDRSIRLI